MGKLGLEPDGHNSALEAWGVRHRPEVGLFHLGNDASFFMNVKVILKNDLFSRIC